MTTEDGRSTPSESPSPNDPNNDLTEAEWDLIRRNGSIYDALFERRRVPSTDVERHFVGACHRAHAPETPEEIAYLKYRRYQHRLASAHHREREDARNSENADGLPNSEWFTDDNWNKLQNREFGKNRRRGR